MTNSRDRFFLYIHCRDLAEMRRFYSDLVGLGEIYASDEAVGYLHGSVQFTILEAADAPPGTEQWHRQPGWSGGQSPLPSWSFQVSDLQDYGDAVGRLRDESVRSFFDVPKWQGYWSFPVKDPEGNTVELTYAPARAPQTEQPSWPPASCPEP